MVGSDGRSGGRGRILTGEGVGHVDCARPGSCFSGSLTTAPGRSAEVPSFEEKNENRGGHGRK